MISSLYLFRRKIGAFAPKRKLSSREWKDFWAGLQPVSAGWPLVRLGGKSDGGYLVPDDLFGVMGCISPGISNMVDFELDLARLGITSIMYDASIETIPLQHSNFRFRKSFIGSNMHADYLPLKSALEEFPNSSEATLLLQMDIEGCEVSALHSLNIDDLEKFRVLIIEFHRLQDWTTRSYFENFIEPLFNVLLQKFDIVHVHPNNCDGEFFVGKSFFPRALEITFHHKSRGKSARTKVGLPHELDCPNSGDVPDIHLKF